MYWKPRPRERPRAAHWRRVRLNPDGAKQVIADRLFFPTGITIGPDGNLYVSNNGFGPIEAEQRWVREKICEPVFTSRDPSYHRNLAELLDGQLLGKASDRNGN